MAILNFTLNPEALSKLHDALVCLGKFSEAVSIEASHDKLMLSALNTSKSAYASFTLGSKFFYKYTYKPVITPSNRVQEKFNCKIYNKALLSVFKGRVVDPNRERDTSIDRCDVAIEDGEGKSKSRFIIKIFCKHGVVRTYKLIFESGSPMHAVFKTEEAHNKWSISSKALREFADHFGPGTEQLDIFSEDGRASFTSFTEKITSGSEILKQPLHTTIAIDTLEFGEFSVEEQLHIVISVKDFKAIVAHAAITNTMVKALYSRPSSPMQVTYSEEGISSEFILMTIGESRAATATPAPNSSRARQTPKQPTPRQPTPRQSLAATLSSRRNASEMPPPPAPSVTTASAAINPGPSRAPLPPPRPTADSDSLFMPMDDEDDRRWDPETFDGDDNEMLLWNDNMDRQDALTMGSARQASDSGGAIRDINRIARSSNHDANPGSTQRLSPTQNVSQAKGMFDD